MKFVKADLKESQEDFHDIYVKQLQNSIRHIKESREMEERFMILEEMLRDERAAGRREERQSILRSFLEDFGSIPPELEKKLFEESDATVLKNWLKIAATSKSIEVDSEIYTKNPVILYWTVKLSYAFGYYSGTSPIFKSMSQRNLCLIRQYLSKKMQRNSIVF
ncbi:MAG: hypothetical protein ACLUJR_07790 [Mediterraneibacter gnavus]